MGLKKSQCRLVEAWDVPFSPPVDLCLELGCRLGIRRRTMIMA